MRTTLRRSLAASAVLALTAVPTAVHADPGQKPEGAGKPAHAGKPADKPGKPADKPGKPADKPGKPADKPGKPADKPAKPADKPAKPADKPAKPGKPESPGKSAAAEDAKDNPPGNNGTVKIAGPDDLVGHPSNNPHPGCTFLVEWYGFDQGEDIVSTVTFTPHAPTSDAVISGASPSQVFVGGDAAGGGTDLDGRQAYTLAFDGEPHPQQGYHVKLTVETPYSHGAETKSKVFWVEPCETTPSQSEDDAVEDDVADESVPGAELPEEQTPEGDAAGEELSDDEAGTAAESGASVADVLGIELFAGEDDATGGDRDVAGRAGVSPAVDAAVPTSVDSGLVARLAEGARSPLALALAGLGAALAVGGIAYRRRAAGA